MKNWITGILSVIILIAVVTGTVHKMMNANAPQTENITNNTETKDNIPPTDNIAYNEETTDTAPQTNNTTNSTSIVASGNCNESVIWSLDSDGALTICGTGAIGDFAKGANNQPWQKYRNAIVALVVEDGITRIGDRAFQSCQYLKSAAIGNGVTSIGEWAFQNCYALSDVRLQNDVYLENGAFQGTPVEWNISAKDSTLYASSNYYAALHKVALVGNYREDIINIALSQVGYHEGDSEKDYAGNNSNGSNDYTEYGRYMGSVGGAWCSEFASWCIRKAGVPTEIIANSRSANVVNFTKDTSAKWYSWDQTVYGGGDYLPRKGDLILWAWDENSHSIEEHLSHTSILFSMDKQNDGSVVIKTIDGNSSNSVKKCKYTVNASNGSLVNRTGRVCYIISPNY